MRIVEVEIENFRSLRCVKIPVDDLTILIGRNGAGKSSLLKALDLFFNPNSKYAEEDFYGKDTSKPIKITVKFEIDTTEEIEEFQKYVREEDGKKYIKVMKLMRFPASKSNQSYHGVRLGIPQFSGLNSLKRDDLIQKYTKLQQEFPDLPNLRRNPTKKEILKALKEYESSHPEMCTEIPVEDQFFGYREVGRGKIEKFIKFQLVPAIKDVSEETEYKKGSIITELTRLIIEKHIRSIPEFNSLEDRYKNLLKTLEKKGRKAETRGLLLELSHEITQILEKFAPNTKAYINWGDLEEFKMPLPTPRVSIEEDGFKASVDRVGHGTQRALLFSLLHYLAEKKYETSNTEDKDEDSVNESKLTLFLAIEELELYQHPQRQKHLKKLFKYLAGNTFGMFNVQVMYSTHSPFLIDVDTFDNLRVFKKTKIPGSRKLKETKTYWYSQHKLREELASLGVDAPSKQLRQFTMTVNPIVNEGFFADKIVIVEGESDKAALEVVSEYNGVDLEGNNISIIPVGGKGNLLTAYLMFKGFKIPTYVIWDLDADSDNQNRRLFSAVNYRPPKNINSSIIKRNFAVLNKNLEEVIKKDLGMKNWSILFSKLRKEGIVREKKDLKNYASMRRFIELWYNPPKDIEGNLRKSSGESLKTLEKIVKKITRL